MAPILYPPSRKRMKLVDGKCRYPISLSNRQMDVFHCRHVGQYAIVTGGMRLRVGHIMTHGLARFLRIGRRAI